MIKYSVLLFNLIGLFIYHLFFQANVTVTQNVPTSAAAAGSFEVDVTINKSDVSGFAKFEEDFPNGFTATAIKKSGATILSSDNDIRFIWASLPSDGVITISFRVTVDSSVSGNRQFTGKFLYVVNNERQEADAPPATINITPLAGNTPVATAPPPSDTSKQSIQQAAAPPQSIIVPPAQTQAQPLSASQTLSASSVAPAGDLTVTVLIRRGNVTGFAKLEETIPNGVIAEGVDLHGSSFTFVDNKAKFVWLTLPADSAFSISYKLTPSSTLTGTQSVSGEFSYLLNDNAASFEIPANSFTVENTAPRQTPASAPVVTTAPAPTPAPVTAPTPVPAPPAAPNVAVADTLKQQAPPANRQTQAVTPEVTGAQGNVKYRVQIMALHHAVKSSYLSNKYNITENINEEMLEGYTKYTVGHFDDYKAVRDHREEIRNKGVAGPFVVAYSNGQRITVQEALMITRQQWYK